MTKDDLRRLALVLPGAEEKLHFNKADFRVKNKIFVSLKDDAIGVIKLSPAGHDGGSRATGISANSGRLGP